MDSGGASQERQEKKNASKFGSLEMTDRRFQIANFTPCYGRNRSLSLKINLSEKTFVRVGIFPYQYFHTSFIAIVG